MSPDTHLDNHPDNHPDAHQNVHQHVDSVGTYVLVFLALICLTVLTTAVAFVNLGPFSVVVALGIACCKMLLVSLFFMHVRHSTRLTRLVVLGGLLWLGIMLLLTLGDVMTRGWVGVPGR
jgi:cytochrome c oxidase subunit 4